MVLPYPTEETAPQETQLYEKPLPETPNLENLAKLFELPKGADEKNRDLLQRAQEELVQLFQRPVNSAKNTLSEGSIEALQESAREAHAQELTQMMEALNFLDDICRNPALSKTSKTILIVSDEEEGGIRFKLSDEHKQPVGKIYNDRIYSVEIVVRTGQLATNETYTPMQLNFRFLKKGTNEVGSLRVDLHNRNHDESGRNEVQLDLQLGSAQYLNSTHKRVDSLNADSEEETRERFNILLSAFILNFADKISENENIVVGGPIDKHDVNKKHLAKVVARLSNGLPMQVPVEDAPVVLSAEEQATALELSSKLQATTETLGELKEVLTNNVSTVTVEALAEAVNNENDKKDNQTEDDQATVLAWLAGKDNIDFNNLNEVVKLQDRLTVLADFLKTNFSGIESDAVIWNGGYQEAIAKVREIALEKLINSNDESALRDLDKITSFMAIVPLEK